MTFRDQWNNWTVKYPKQKRLINNIIESVASNTCKQVILFYSTYMHYAIQVLKLWMSRTVVHIHLEPDGPRRRKKVKVKDCY